MIEFRSLAFTVALFCCTGSLSSAASTPSCQLESGGASHTVGGNSTGAVWPWQIFQSSPFNPPELEINYDGSPLAEGLMFFTQSNFRAVNSIKEAAPLMMTDRGELVWNGPISNATNLHAATYKGSPVLTYWSGLSSEGGNVGHGFGNVTYLDTSYRNILTVCPKLGLVIPGGKTYPCEADFHESFLTDNDTIVLTAYNATPADLSAIGGSKDGWIYDNLILEIEPESEEILFRWSSAEHVPVDQTKFPLLAAGNESFPLDYFHVNSVEKVGDSFLINARHTWSTYFVSPSGNVEWTLQGETGGDFGPLPDEARFKWQHHPRAHNVTNSSISLSYFNNFAFQLDNGTRPSNGLELQLSLPPNKSQSPELLRIASDPAQPIYADSQGSTQLLENGGIVMTYGQIPVMKEYGTARPDAGTAKWTARAGRDNAVQVYRGFKQRWSATPYYSPDLVLRRARGSGGCATGYVSWNGATEITGWEIWVGSNNKQSHLQRVGQVVSRGFETQFRVKGRCAQAVALEGDKVARRSNIVCIHPQAARMSLKTISRPDANDSQDFDHPIITGFTPVASYNWLDDPDPTILVPGCPPIWSPPSNPQPLSPDTGFRYIDQNADRYPTSPLMPLFSSITHINPSYPFQSIDIISDRSPLRKLYAFAANEPDLHRFRFGVSTFSDKENNKRTVVFHRMEKRTKDEYEGIKFWGYRSGFENQYMRTDGNAQGSRSHYRISAYEFGGLKFLVRSAVDAYIPGGARSSTPGIEKKIDIAKSVKSLGFQDPVAGKAFDENGDEEKTPQTPENDTTSSKEDGTLKVLSSPNKTDTALLQPHETLLELVTRSKFSKFPFNISVKMPDLYLAQRKHFTEAYHRNVGYYKHTKENAQGIFMREDIKVRDMGEDLQKWEKDKGAVLGRYLKVVKEIVRAVGRDEDEAGEETGCWEVSCEGNGGDGAGAVLEIKEVKEGSVVGMTQEIGKFFPS
ncbi:MAG: hypothetical protein Q9216_004819 [Gyalolechia sp. 2 TL-2023]